MPKVVGREGEWLHSTVSLPARAVRVVVKVRVVAGRKNAAERRMRREDMLVVVVVLVVVIREGFLVEVESCGGSFGLSFAVKLSDKEN